MALIIAISRAGIDAFWASPAETVPRVRVIEMMPVVLLLSLCILLTVLAGPVMRYMDATARSLHEPHDYMRDVLPEPKQAMLPVASGE
jgi:multicomponent K+:H+ antiporter subunit D